MGACIGHRREILAISCPRGQTVPRGRRTEQLGVGQLKRNGKNGGEMRSTTVFTGAGILAVVAAGVVAACMPREYAPSGQALYNENCAACHGPGGTGDGPAAGAYAEPLPDLTTLAARNDGVFPLREVMTQIDGYGRGARVGEGMPEMGHLLDGPVTRVDTGDGIMTPTPVKLLALARHVESLQR